VDQTGGTSYPPDDANWGLETSLDLDAVSSACPACNILLVEANDNSGANLEAAVNEAVALGAKSVSNSYGGNEDPAELQDDTNYNHPGWRSAPAPGTADTEPTTHLPPSTSPPSAAPC
jgi:hypothetical protein